MNQSELQAELARASKAVNAQPAWMRNILVESSKPANSSPRPPVKDEGQTTAAKKD